MSLLLNLSFYLLACFAPGLDNVYLFFLPGLLPVIIMTGGWFVSLNVFGQALMLVVNLAFYYFIAWWLIRAFQPARGWWPTRSAWES